MILTVTVTVACLKTAVGLITSCGETFVAIFPGGPSYRVWAAAFCVLSFLLANLRLDAILDYSLPVLMFLYPLAIVLILLTLGGGLFGNDRRILRWPGWPPAWQCAACAPAAESRPPAAPCGAAGGFCMLATVMRPR